MGKNEIYAVITAFLIYGFICFQWKRYKVDKELNKALKNLNAVLADIRKLMESNNYYVEPNLIAYEEFIKKGRGFN